MRGTPVLTTFHTRRRGTAPEPPFSPQKRPVPIRTVSYERGTPVLTPFHSKRRGCSELSEPPDAPRGSTLQPTTPPGNLPHHLQSGVRVRAHLHPMHVATAPLRHSQHLPHLGRRRPRLHHIMHPRPLENLPHHPHQPPSGSLAGEGDGVLALVAEFRIQGAGCRVQGAGFWVQGSGCRVQGSGCRVQGAGCRVQGAGFRVQGAGCLVAGGESFGDLFGERLLLGVGD